MSTYEEKVDAILDSSRGIYIPQDFVNVYLHYGHDLRGISQRDIDMCAAGPDEEWYWEAWDAVEQNAVLTEPGTGQRFNVYQDGDVWLVPVDAEWPEE